MNTSQVNTEYDCQNKQFLDTIRLELIFFIMKINVAFIGQKFLLYNFVISFTFNQVEPAQNEQNRKTFDKKNLENYK